MKTSHWIWQRSDWPSFRCDLGALLSAISDAQAAQNRLRDTIAQLPQNLIDEISKKTLVEEVIATSAIEGEKLSRDVVRAAVVRHLEASAPDLKSTRSVDGLIQVLSDASRQYSEPLTLERLCSWHSALFPEESILLPVQTGQLRGAEPMEVVSGPIQRRKVHFQAPPRERLETEVQAFMDWFNSPPKGLDGLLRAGLAHLWFVTVHPFEDGNGRLTRAITDMALAQTEKQPARLFSLSAQILRHRKEYYANLERAQRGDLDVTSWLAWFLEQLRLAVE